MVDEKRYPITALLLGLFGQMLGTGKPVQLEDDLVPAKAVPPRVPSTLSPDMALRTREVARELGGGLGPGRLKQPGGKAGKAFSGS